MAAQGILTNFNINMTNNVQALTPKSFSQAVHAVQTQGVNWKPPRRKRGKGNLWFLDGPLRGLHAGVASGRIVMVQQRGSGIAGFSLASGGFPPSTSAFIEATYERLGDLENGHTAYRWVKTP